MAMRFQGGLGHGLIGLLLVLMASQAVADQPVDPNRKKAEAVLQGILRERQNFKSGVAKFSGTRIMRTEDDPDKNGSITGLLAFKTDGDKLRFDKEETWGTGLMTMRRANRAPGESEWEVKPVPIRRRFLYTRNAEYSVSWMHETPATRSNLVLLKPHDSNGAVAAFNHMYDILSSGIIDHRGFERGLPVKQVIDDLLALRVVKVTEENDRTILELESKWARHRLVVETNDGFRPTELTVTSLPVPGSTAFKDITKTRWQRQGNTDVPVEMVVQQDIPEVKSFVEYTLKYDWKWVNKPVNPKYFDYHSFPDVPTDLGILVIDQRGYAREILGQWKGNGVIEPLVK